MKRSWKNKLWIRRICTFIFVVAIGFSFSMSTLLAGEIKGNEKKGKYLFKAKCKQCHDPEHGKGKVKVTPANFTQAQWKSFFKRNKHKRKKDISDQFTEEELIHIKTFLINHAADTDQPETCG